MSFRQITGQRGAIKILQREMDASSISGAYLFIGPDGVGKTLTALTFAKALNCKRGGTDSCDSCSSCRKIDHLNHPDVHLIKAEGNSIKIEQIRTLKREVMYKPYEGKKKVWIIQEADKLTLEASNSLLKILEEPPSDTVLILISQSPEKLLPTITSRCEIIRYLPLSSREIEKIIDERLAGCPQKVRLIGRLARGRMARALQLIGEEELLKEREEILKGIGEDLDIEKIFNLASQWKNYERARIEEILNILLFWFHDLLILKQGADQGLLINLDRIEQLRKQRENYSSWAIKQAIQVIERTREYLQNNVSPKHALEVMGLKLRELRNLSILTGKNRSI